ncbi:hypothetical protein IE4872_PC00112 (plasmid) [Rhizobium gallicum]|uniref:Uncharacterized protein n=1 Tax=Rhizobium gallicum TaxID=56730 RepID=A0A1L5NQG6_9HYPH|nr:hypothetical protein IE4872_PC00112 [Rhizobium gallicum]
MTYGAARRRDRSRRPAGHAAFPFRRRRTIALTMRLARDGASPEWAETACGLRER